MTPSEPAERSSGANLTRGNWTPGSFQVAFVEVPVRLWLTTGIGGHLCHGRGPLNTSERVRTLQMYLGSLGPNGILTIDPLWRLGRGGLSMGATPSISRTPN